MTGVAVSTGRLLECRGGTDVTEFQAEQHDGSSEQPHNGPAQTAGPSVASNYIEQANRAQFLLNHGHIGGAREVFQSILATCKDEPSYERAVLLERMGFCYLIEGQPLAAAGLFQEATETTDKLVLSNGIRSLQGVIQSELGEAFDAAGYPGEARKAFETALEIAGGLNDNRARAVDLDHLGLLALKEGQAEEARAHFEASLEIFRELGQPAPQAVAQQHLASAFQAMEAWEAAEGNYVGAALALKQCGDTSGCSHLYAQAAAMNVKAGRFDAAEALYRSAVAESRQDTKSVDLRQHIVGLARLLQRHGGKLAEARDLLEEALAASETSLDADIWMIYGQLANVIERLAEQEPEAEAREVAETEARHYRHIHHYAPRLLATLEGLGEGASYGRAVALERLGRCCLMGGRPAPAVILFRQGLDALDQLSSDAAAKGLAGVLRSGLGDAFRLAGYLDESRAGYEGALAVAESLGDLRGQAAALIQLGALATESGQPEQAAARLRAGLRLADVLEEPELRAALDVLIARLPASVCGDTDVEQPAEVASSPPDAPFTMHLREDVTTQCAFGSDLLVDVRRDVRINADAGSGLSALAGAVRPMIVPRVRTAIDDKGDLRFYVPSGEPLLDQREDCIIMQNAAREVVVSGKLGPVWALVRTMDGTRTVDAMLAQMEPEDRAGVARLLVVLAYAGAIDVSGRPTARFLHAATKKGFLIGGGLEGENVTRLVADGHYRAYEGATRVAIERDVPERLTTFHTLTRSRRSRRDYTGEAVRSEDLAALLDAACGLTGAAPCGEGEVRLRSYPSSGALYAVEIYPVALNVDGLEPAVYHYIARDSALEAVRPLEDWGSFISACLPVERQMVGSAGAIICLTGNFRRHETKYGEGGYRMMVAEAGHISQNLILAATALGLSARPFGGVFDTLVNRQLGLHEDEEQFLLSVLIGHAGDEAEGAKSPIKGPSR